MRNGERGVRSDARFVFPNSSDPRLNDCNR